MTLLGGMFSGPCVVRERAVESTCGFDVLEQFLDSCWISEEKAEVLGVSLKFSFEGKVLGSEAGADEKVVLDVFDVVGFALAAGWVVDLVDSVKMCIQWYVTST